MFDLLASADLLVEDAGVAALRLQQLLGVLPARGDFLQLWPRWGFESHWCRVAPRLGYAPTHVEVIGPYGDPDPLLGHPHIAELYGAQQPRAYKTHSTPIAVTDLDTLIARLNRRGVTYRLDEPEGELPFRRLWLGRCIGDPWHYDASADGGLYLELIATADMGFPIRTRPVTPEPNAGDGLVRVAARTMLVNDLELTLEQLRLNLGWAPRVVQESGGVRRACFGFTHVHSAVLEVLEPVAGGTPVHEYLQRWGPGPYGMRIEVDDVAASATRLTAAGVAFRRDDGDQGPVLLPDPDQLYGVQFELCEATR